MTSSLTTEQLIETACEQTGLDEFGGETFRVGLDHLIDGLRNEARLNDVGEAMAPMTVLGHLANRLQVTDWHRRYPEIDEADVTPPIVMIGMGRTGSTILHDLFGQDPANRVPRTWEVDHPSPPPETATYETDPRIEESQAGIDLAYEMRPELRSMHPMGARLGQECIVITGGEFASPIFNSQFRLPSYLRWVTSEADMAPAYRWHRRFLQLLQWRNPGGRWVLKTGAHLWALPELLGEYPDAFIVQTHRDPLRIVASLSSLFAVVQATASDGVTMGDVAAEWVDPVFDALDRSVTARENDTVPADRVVDVHYRAFMTDPFGTIRTIYDRLGAELTPDAEDRMRRFLAENRADKHGAHEYSFADTGLDAGRVRDRARRYVEYFDVESEPSL
jgi:Sulfotransferase family